PFLREGNRTRQILRAGQQRLEVVVLEKSTYTHLIELRQLAEHPDALLAALALRVRLYHDAQLAEVNACQEHYRLRPRYEYPNRNMYHRDEKRQTNYLLHDWLHALATMRFDIDDEPVVTEA
ncbi:MAG TPA: DUF1249 domain-containing protein, partial [Chromatiales bacterium]|nr:DUF1249 domain-containing protein [Chromatiales bacterium]